MPNNKNTWELAELYLSGKMPQTDKDALQAKLASDAAFKIEFDECTGFLETLGAAAKQANFKAMLGEIHESENTKPYKKLLTKIIALPQVWKTASVAATVAILASTVTYWTINPSIKKNDSQYNTISREVEHIKKGLKNNTDAIENIKKNTLSPTPPPSDVKFTGTGFALTNDGYFVTAWHVINQGNFDSVYILNNHGEYYRASLVRHDDKADIAILKVDKKNFKFAKSDVPYSIAKTKAGIGSRIFTLGFPKDDEVYCEGYVSSRNGFEGDALQYTLQLPVTHGQSGSPIVDANGNVVGILTAVGSQGEANTYAVSTQALVDLMEDTPNLNKLHQHKTSKLGHMAREQQIEKMEDFTFSVKVYKK